MRQEGLKKEQLDIELVRAFVVAAHGNLSEVKVLLQQEPGLVNAVMNWGGNDWESGLGAAAHTGNRDIAKYLIERGAWIDIFAAAMLGKLDIVKSILASFPDMIHSTGPHGIPLIRHAERGGEEAYAVLEYLQDVLKSPQPL